MVSIGWAGGEEERCLQQGSRIDRKRKRRGEKEAEGRRREWRRKKEGEEGKEGVMKENALFPSYFNRARTTETPAWRIKAPKKQASWAICSTPSLQDVL